MLYDRRSFARTILLIPASSGCGLRNGHREEQKVFLNGVGATFPYPIYAKWFHQYRRINPQVWINYQPIGSGGGIRQLQAGTIDFGATDIPMTDVQMRQFANPVLHLPTVLGAVVPTYHLPGIDGNLRMTAEVLADIYMGRIDTWRHPELLAANAHLRLPDERIIVVHRSDGSGTTYVWTDYLTKVSPKWRADVGAGAAVRWPVGLGAKGNEGVSGVIKQMPYSIGYLELVYAAHAGLPHSSVLNNFGRFVRADRQTIEAAASVAAGGDGSQDFRVSITNAPGEDAYPIASFTWLLVPERIADDVKRNALKACLRWMLTAGQREAGPLGYVALPSQVVERAMHSIEQIH